MNQSTFQVHKSWLLRATLILVITALADGLAVWFTKRPLRWATWIASSLPLSMIVFVALPLLRQEAESREPRLPR